METQSPGTCGSSPAGRASSSNKPHAEAQWTEQKEQRCAGGSSAHLHGQPQDVQNRTWFPKRMPFPPKCTTKIAPISPKSPCLVSGASLATGSGRCSEHAQPADGERAPSRPQPRSQEGYSMQRFPNSSYHEAHYPSSPILFNSFQETLWLYFLQNDCSNLISKLAPRLPMPFNLQKRPPRSTLLSITWVTESVTLTAEPREPLRWHCVHRCFVPF